MSSIAILGRMYLDKQINRVLICCPTSIVNVWPSEFEKFADYPVTVMSIIGTKEKRIQKLEDLPHSPGLQVAVINYESTWRLEEELIQYNADIIICDESQRIKGNATAQSKCLHRLGDKASYRIILSGTPVQNSPLDLWSQYRFLDKSIFGNSYYQHKGRYALMGGYQQHQVIAYINQREMTQKAHSIAYRVTKDEALDLPETIDQFRYVDLEPKARKLYNEIEKESYAELENGGEVTAAIILTRILRLQQITGGFISDDDKVSTAVSTAKLEALEDIIDDAGRKIVVFARFRPEISAIKKMCERKKILYAMIDGSVDMADRGAEVERFQNDKKCMVFIAQIQTAGLGITLTAADIAVFYSLDYNYANYSQALSRIHRIGQMNKCTYIHLLASKSIDSKIMEALRKKESIASSVIDNWRELLSSEV